jgi:hypothetical protein
MKIRPLNRWMMFAVIFAQFFTEAMSAVRIFEPWLQHSREWFRKYDWKISYRPFRSKAYCEGDVCPVCMDNFEIESHEIARVPRRGPSLSACRQRGLSSIAGFSAGRSEVSSHCTRRLCTLPCGHQLHMSCVQQIVEHSERNHVQLRCPVCRAGVALRHILRWCPMLPSIRILLNCNNIGLEEDFETAQILLCGVFVTNLVMYAVT